MNNVKKMRYRRSREYLPSDEPQYCDICHKVRWGTGPDPTLVNYRIDFCGCDSESPPQCKFCGFEEVEGNLSGWTISSNGDECPTCKGMKDIKQ